MEIDFTSTAKIATGPRTMRRQMHSMQCALCGVSIRRFSRSSRGSARKRVARNPRLRVLQPWGPRITTGYWTIIDDEIPKGQLGRLSFLAATSVLIPNCRDARDTSSCPLQTLGIS